jgi:16S rRNA (guanine527-N7)-methyltransferase
MERLDALAETLTRWSRAINLVARATLPDLWHRHIADSLQLWPLAPDKAKSWVDLGTGAGFPGLVIAAIAADVRPALRVTLVESDTRKCAYLAEAARAMGISVTIRPVRIETLDGHRYDVVSARALAPLMTLLPMARRLAAPGGTILLPKGGDVESEFAALPAIDRDTVRRLPSKTSADAAILVWTLPDG